MQFDDFLMRGASNGKAQFLGESLLLTASGETDWFHHPAGQFQRGNVITAYREVHERVFTLSTKVSVNFSSAFDGGVIFVQVDDNNWAKLAFELSGAGNPTVVSVVTRGTSDDADGPSIEGGSVWLRIHCDGHSLAMHFSVDGVYWRFLRWLSIPGLEQRPLKVGFGVQAPTGSGCSAKFDSLGWSLEPILDFRDGS
ncbi:DUF1349 domain-containing protein [Pseudomonas fulva]|uniref:DUF1349 domain-containing protein n=1 Tax=Pseudomonas fulva TaxID=47880 RepID=UPI0018AB5807|nr:DUF1349 domain-containing protein [Pseudomonas fulva]MBF8774063.1 DUF1349 domain-containing protein [Pseudomonas fulva]